MERMELFASNVLTVWDDRDDKSKSLRDTRSPSSNYLPNDWRWAASPTSMRKTSEGLQRVSDRFHFIVSMHQMGLGTGTGGTNLRQQWEREGQRLAGNRACILFRNNIGQEATHIPLTPWVVMHRVIHHIHADSTVMLPLRDRGIFESLADVYNHLAGHETGKVKFGFGWNIRGGFKAFLKTILTTRAGRENKINNDLDIAAELFAQHHFGGIRLLRTEHWPEDSKHSEIGTDCWRRHISFDAREYMERIRIHPETNRCLELLERDLSNQCEEIGRYLQGKLLVF